MRKYHDEHGKWPTVEELDQAGAFAGIELPDFGMVFVNTEKIRNAPTKVALAPGMVEGFIQASVHKWEHLPPSPYAFLKQSLPGYVVWPDSTIMSGTSNKGDVKNKFEMIVSRRRGRCSSCGVIFAFIETMANSYQEEHQGKAPEKFEDFAPQFVTQHDPFGGNYQWDPKTETASCTGMPGFTKNAGPIVTW